MKSLMASFYGHRRRTAPVQPSCRTGTECEGRERVVHNPFALPSANGRNLRIAVIFGRRGPLRTSRARNEPTDFVHRIGQQCPGRREAHRLAGGAAFEAVSQELAFASVSTRTHGSVGLTRPFLLGIVNFLLTRLADSWLSR